MERSDARRSESDVRHGFVWNTRMDVLSSRNRIVFLPAIARLVFAASAMPFTSFMLAVVALSSLKIEFDCVATSLASVVLPHLLEGECAVCGYLAPNLPTRTP